MKAELSFCNAETGELEVYLFFDKNCKSLDGSQSNVGRWIVQDDDFTGGDKEIKSYDVARRLFERRVAYHLNRDGVK